MKLNHAEYVKPSIIHWLGHYLLLIGSHWPVRSSELLLFSVKLFQTLLTEKVKTFNLLHWHEWALTSAGNRFNRWHFFLLWKAERNDARNASLFLCVFLLKTKNITIFSGLTIFWIKTFHFSENRRQHNTQPQFQEKGLARILYSTLDPS